MYFVKYFHGLFAFLLSPLSANRESRHINCYLNAKELILYYLFTLSIKTDQLFRTYSVFSHTKALNFG